ncbi:TPA: hypothetical protein ACXEMW_003182 [Proteus mirabilis]
MASVSHVNQENSTKKLHYIYDPLCGWCYGIAPLIEVVSHEYPHVLTLHGGGLFTPTRKVTGAMHGKSMLPLSMNVLASYRGKFLASNTAITSPIQR